MVNKNWIEYVIHSPDLEHKAKLFNRHKSQVCIYLVNAKRFIIEDHNLYIITMTDISELEIAYEQMKDQAIRDELTQIYNRRKFNEVLDIEISRSHRTMMSFSIIMFDIDDFKKINDTYGHEVGDQVLIEISKTVHGAIRKSDIFSRWGGEEFMILAPSIYLDGAIKQAEKLRQMIEEHPFEGIPEVEKVTCSFGVSEFCLKEDKESLLKRVDENLYNAKHSGKNCVMAS